MNKKEFIAKMTTFLASKCKDDGSSTHNDCYWYTTKAGDKLPVTWHVRQTLQLDEIESVMKDVGHSEEWTKFMEDNKHLLNK